MILLYHGVLPTVTARDGTLDYNFISEKVFQWQLHYLKKHYTIFPLSDVVDRIGKGLSLPKYAAVVTFDDGFRNNLTVALPSLKKYKIPACVFVATGFIGTENQMLWTERLSYYIRHTIQKEITFDLIGEKISIDLSSKMKKDDAIQYVIDVLKKSPKNKRVQCLEEIFSLSDFQTFDWKIDHDRYSFLNWSEVKELVDNGVEIGSHTVNHEILSRLTTEEVVYETTISKKEIESKLKRPCFLFSYPNGSKEDFLDRDKQVLEQSGYRCAVTLIQDLNPLQPDLMALKRHNVGRRHNTLLFRAIVSGFLPFIRNLATNLH